VTKSSVVFQNQPPIIKNVSNAINNVDDKTFVYANENINTEYVNKRENDVNKKD
jgi:hypothetical protein